MKARPSRRLRKKPGTRKMVGGSAAPQIYVFYHIYCNTNTLGIVRDQAMKIIYSGLYKKAKQIYCFLAGGKEHVDSITSYIKTLPSKFHIEKTAVDDTTYERLTLNHIKHKISDSDRFLYLHSKGVSRVQENSMASECVTLWRNYMEYFLIAQFEKCLDKLQTHDIVGVAYKDVQIGPHFSGNFWWSTGKYFKKLSTEKEIGDAYYDSEAYIFKGSPNAYSLDDKALHNTMCLYSTPLYPQLYVDKEVK